jgi:pimeloyl-ACP methyl ester carboxylesterase
MLNYEVEGRGAPLLLIHGFGISFSIWQEMNPLLRDQFTLVQVELPGIGSSPPPQQGQAYLDSAVEGIEVMREALGIGRWHVVSYSSGTRVGEHYLNAHASRVDRAVFICPARVRPLKAILLRLAIRLDRSLPSIGDWVLSGPRLRILIDLFGFNLKKNERSPRWFAEISSQPVEIIKETLRSMPGGGGMPFSIPDLPALFIWGSEDLLTDTPRFTLRDRLIRAAHSAPQTDPVALAGILIPFLKGTAGD